MGSANRFSLEYLGQRYTVCLVIEFERPLFLAKVYLS